MSLTKINSGRRHQNRDSPLDDASRGDLPEQKTTNKNLFMYLNAIILQYLETLGLSESYTIFHRECQETGYPLPPRLSTYRPSNYAGVKLKDVDQLIKYFDDDKNHELIQKWESIIAEDTSSKKDLTRNKINTNLRIYAYINIPHRKRFPSDEKQHSLQLLLDYFKSNFHEEINDPEILSLYALPHVQNPSSHPIFSKFFKKSWVLNLKSSLRSFCMELCQPAVNPLDTDIGKLYTLWSHTNMVMNDCILDVERRSLQMGLLDNFQLESSSASARNSLIAKCDLPENSPFIPFFKGLYKLKEENDHLKLTTKKMKDEYLKKIQLCNALVTCLRELYSCKNETEETDSRKRIFDVYSHLIMPHNEASKQKSVKDQKMMGDQEKSSNGRNMDFRPDRNQKEDTNTTEKWDSYRSGRCHNYKSLNSLRGNQGNVFVHNPPTQRGTMPSMGYTSNRDRDHEPPPEFNRPSAKNPHCGNNNDDEETVTLFNGKGRNRPPSVVSSVSHDFDEIDPYNLSECTLLFGSQSSRLFLDRDTEQQQSDNNKDHKNNYEYNSKLY